MGNLLLRLAVLIMLLGCEAQAEPGPRCTSSHYRGALAVRADIRRTDLLLVIDDSPSMVEELAALRAQMPGLFEAIVSALGADLMRVAIVPASAATGVTTPMPVWGLPVQPPGRGRSLRHPCATGGRRLG